MELLIKKMVSDIVNKVLRVSGILSAVSCNIEKEWDKIEIDSKPNVLIFSCEDIDCALPCYGDSTVETPNIDRLAAEGILFSKCYTNPVSAPSRYSIITGMNPCSSGAANMRSYSQKLPDDYKYMTSYFMDNGYFCTNNSKTDYNFYKPAHESLWDECSATAHWHHAPSGKNFFSVYNDAYSHESSIWQRNWDACKLDIDDVKLPPFYPDDTLIRIDMCRKYQHIQDVDFHLGLILKQLEKKDMLENTIIVFFSDNGGMMPKYKREQTDQGTHVPLIIRLPGKINAGMKYTHLITLMDLYPTLMSLCNIKPPVNIDGKALLGRFSEPTRLYVYGGLDRIDTWYDVRRSVRNDSMLYIRNYYPEIPVYTRSAYQFQMQTTRQLIKMLGENRLNNNQREWLVDDKPVEQLFDTRKDYYQMNNLAAKPEYKAVLERLRKEHIKNMLEIKDVALISELRQSILEEKYKKPVYEIMRSADSLPLSEIIMANYIMSDTAIDPSIILSYLQHQEPAIRYWALTTIGRQPEKYFRYAKEIQKADNNEIDIALAAAFTMFRIGDRNYAIKYFSELIGRLKNSDVNNRNSAYFAGITMCWYISRMATDAMSLKDKLVELKRNRPDFSNAVETALNTIEGKKQ